MDWLREWILRIAGIIILISAWDIIMIEGEMKKYIKPVLGIVLVFAMVRPIAGNIFDKINIEEGYSTVYGQALSEEMADRQYIDIKKGYEQSLGVKIAQSISDKYGIRAEITVKAMDKKSGFGKLELVTVKVESGEENPVDAEEIKKYLEKEFGIDKASISVLVKNREGG